MYLIQSHKSILLRRIGEKAVVFIVAEEFVGRPGLAGIGLGTARAKTYEQREGDEFG